MTSAQTNTPATAVTSAGQYMSLPVETDPDVLAQAAISYLSAKMPGWVASEGTLEVWLIRSFARMAAETAQVAGKVPLSIFNYFGSQLAGIAPLTGSPAGCNATVYCTDTAGHTIPAGTLFGYPVTDPSGDSDSVLFGLSADLVIPAGAQQSAVGAATLIALEPGVSGNGLPPGGLSLITNLAYLAGASTTTPTAGGADAEDQNAYLNRLSGALQLLSPRPILPADFAALARNQPGVARATAISGYNPANGSQGNPRMITVACVDAAGNALSSSGLQAVVAALAAQREVNFVVNGISPTYTPVNVSAQLTAARGASVQSVTTAGQAALAAFLSPANWGGPAPGWTNNPIVRYLAVGSVLSQVPGVAFVTGIQMSANNDGLITGDVPLAGAIPLPRPGNLSVVVTPGQ